MTNRHVLTQRLVLISLSSSFREPQPVSASQTHSDITGHRTPSTTTQENTTHQTQPLRLTRTSYGTRDPEDSRRPGAHNRDTSLHRTSGSCCQDPQLYRNRLMNLSFFQRSKALLHSDSFSLVCVLRLDGQ